MKTEPVISRKQLLETVGRFSGQRVYFNIPVEFDELIQNKSGIEYLNNLVDDLVEDGYLLEDLNYYPEKLEGETIIVNVDALTKTWLRGHV